MTATTMPRGIFAVTSRRLLARAPTICDVRRREALGARLPRDARERAADGELRVALGAPRWGRRR
ncbi:MAG: hypothetical protein V9G15_06150 [Dermatophilaceae bacterium]